ncbi:Olfactory receptor 9I1 [Galemys pyrenaicus]|uniref:Olfactory receptor n=1 Tax=Galemys pyrenaicus TaxID=202257 RepID=A0A8J6DK91_GALPY|nr:Olfactory receptor 9I1 [Galemys pyrenaicus]
MSVAGVWDVKVLTSQGAGTQRQAQKQSRHLCGRVVPPSLKLFKFHKHVWSGRVTARSEKSQQQCSGEDSAVEGMDSTGTMAENGTVVTDFIQLQVELQMGLFFVFLVLYLITMGGNLGMIALIQSDPRLQTPMYFFLSHLSFLDVCYSSVIIPQLLETLGTDKMVITYERCASQFFFFTLCASTECFLLAVMAYDRYVAVWDPLLYATSMTPQARLWLVAGAYAGATVNSVVRTGCTFSISFCKSNLVDFFFCDLPPLLQLACSETRPRERLIYLFALWVITTSILVILISYLFIIRQVAKPRLSPPVLLT